MTDQYTETRTDSWGQRLKSAIAGVLFGLILFIAAFPLLWWNEGRTVDRMKALDVGRRIVVEAPYTSLDPNNEGKLVHISGSATTEDVLKDNLFGVQAKALKLKRIVEVYQWKETSSTQKDTNVGGSQTTSTTYSYSKAWSDRLIDSGHFKQPQQHQNPASKAYNDQDLIASIQFGAYKLSSSFVGQIDKFEPYQLLQQDHDRMDASLKAKFRPDGNYYVSGDPGNPQIGDMKVRFEIAYPTEVSVIGKQSEGSIVPYSLRTVSSEPVVAASSSKLESLLRSVDSSVQNSSQTLDLLQIGIMDADGMFDASERNNSLITWGVRLLGIVLMWIGLQMIFSPLAVLASFLPFMGTLVDVGFGLVSGLVSLVLGLCTIAAAWMFYRPFVGIVLVVAAVALGSHLIKRIGAAKAKQEPSNLAS